MLHSLTYFFFNMMKTWESILISRRSSGFAYTIISNPPNDAITALCVN